MMLPDKEGAMSVRQDTATRVFWAKLQRSVDGDYRRVMTRERAEQIRRWRKEEAYSFQKIACAYVARYGGTVSQEDEVIQGMRICRIAGEVLGERLR
jgi:hypothetical protein